jgi:hypothetical protein
MHDRAERAYIGSGTCCAPGLRRADKKNDGIPRRSIILAQGTVLLALVKMGKIRLIDQPAVIAGYSGSADRNMQLPQKCRHCREN